MKKALILGALTAAVVFTSLTTFAQAPAPMVDGATLFNKIHALRLRLQPDNSEENGVLYMLNTPANLQMHLQFYQMMPNDAENTSLHIWVSDSDAHLHPELLGKPSAFPQMWVRYHGDDLIEVGASHVSYPASFGLDATAHPVMVYDFADKTVLLP